MPEAFDDSKGGGVARFGKANIANDRLVLSTRQWGLCWLDANRSWCSSKQDYERKRNGDLLHDLQRTPCYLILVFQKKLHVIFQIFHNSGNRQCMPAHRPCAPIAV